MSTHSTRVRLVRLLLLGSVALGAAACAPRRAVDFPRFNVLFIVADDLNCDLGCYGDRAVRTPNIDRLAARGVRFTRAYCQFPLCSPSRSSFLTGRRPDATGVLLNPSAQRPYSPHFREKIPDTVTLPQLFRQEGWYAARAGKLYHYGVPLHIGTASLDDYASWDLALNPRGCDRDQLSKVFSLEPGQFGGTLSWLAMTEDDPRHTDGLIAAEAEKLLERFERDAQQFFLGVGFFRPHTPYVAPRRYFDLYPPGSIELPALDAKDRERMPAPAYASAKKEQDAMTDAQRRLAIQAYRASISFLDAQVGRVLDALERLDLARSTVVVFTSDHGYHLGDHGLWQKRSLFERSARVPLIIAVPGASSAGRAAPGVVEMVDLYPTLAVLCGLKPPAYVEGADLRPVLEDPEHRVKEAAFTQVDRAGFPGRSLRTERWRYTEWDEGKQGVELYDYEQDPSESRNLATDPAHATEVERLKGLLRSATAPAPAAAGPAKP